MRVDPGSQLLPDGTRCARRVELGGYSQGSRSQQTCWILTRLAADQNSEILPVEKDRTQLVLPQVPLLLYAVEVFLIVVKSCVDGG